MRLPENDKDLMIQAKEFWLLNFDNASGMKGDISDALCTLATGGGSAVRRLYTDGELNVLSFMRPFMINGIGNFASRADLMERAIPLRLPPIADGARRREAEILAEFHACLPDVLGDLCDALVVAIRNFSKVEPPTTLRMADAAHWILAGSEALGVEGAAIIKALETAQDDLFVERINDDPLVTRLRRLTYDKPFKGYIGDLFAEIAAEGSPFMPKGPSQLSSALKRLRPALSRVGVNVEFGEKDRRGRLIRIESERVGPP